MSVWFFVALLILIPILTFVFIFVAARMIFGKEGGAKIPIVSIVSIVLSIIALLVSVWSSYSPPNIAVRVNSPVWLPRANSDTPGQYGIGLKVTCVFSNSGAQTGVVNDLLIKMKGEDGTSCFLYFPAMVIDEPQFSIGATPDTKWLNGPFYPVAVQGKQSLLLSFLFAPYPGNPNCKTASFPRQKYKLALLSRMGGGRDYDEQESFTVDMNQASFDSLGRGTMVQVVSDLDNLRNDVK